MVDCPPTGYGPCAPLVTVDDLCNCALDHNLSANTALLDDAIVWASRRTMMATRYRFTGCCTSSIRPCAVPCDPADYLRMMDGLSGPNGHLYDEWGPSGYPTIPLQINNAPAPWFINCWACTCGADCHCGLDKAFALPWLPVRDITEVKIDGVVLGGASYLLKPRTNLLLKTDGSAWPNVQNQHLADTQVGTWSVTFRHGYDLPPDGRPLVADYACQLALRCQGKKCDLPEGVRVVSRPGVEYALLDTDYRAKGLTGFPPLDDWIMQVFGGHSYTRPHLVMNRSRRTAMLQ